VILEFTQADLSAACADMRAAWGPFVGWNETKAQIYNCMGRLASRLEPGVTYSVDRSRLPRPFHVGFGWVDIAVRNRVLDEVAVS